MRTQHRLYRDAQNDYWEVRARRTLAFKKAARTASSVMIMLGVVAVGDTILNGKFGDVAHGVTNLVHRVTGPSTESETQVADSINEAPGTMVTSDGGTSIDATYQTSGGNSYPVVCAIPNASDNPSGILSYADVGGWDCVLINETAAIIAGSLFGDNEPVRQLHPILEPYLAPAPVTSDFATAIGGTFVPA